MPITNFEELQRKLQLAADDSYPVKTYEEKFYTDMVRALQWFLEQNPSDVKQFVNGWIEEYEQRIAVEKAKRVARY